MVGRFLGSVAAGALVLTGMALPRVALADFAPRFSVSPTDPPDHMWGEEWAPGAEVVIEIDDPTNGEGVDFTTPAGTDMGGSFNLEIPFDIMAGQLITVAQGATVKSHTVIDLRVNLVDMLADTVSGLGAPATDTDVVVWHDQLQVAQLSVISDDTGAWVANFSPDFDILPGMWSTAVQADEDGDTTMIVGQPPSFLVFRDWYGLNGSGWPAEIDLQVTADDPTTVTNPDIELTIATDAEGFFEGGWFPGLQPGWLITVTAGELGMTHTVRAISITDADIATNIVRGTADPGTEVWVDVNGGAGGMYATSGGSGEWVADFSGVYDIVAGTEVGAQQTDENGNGTHVGHTVPFPPIPIPPSTSLTSESGGTQTSGVPTVSWRDPLNLTTSGLSGGTATATLTMLGDGFAQTITLVEVPLSSGAYTGTFDPLYVSRTESHHGPASISFTILYPDGTDQQGSFTLYIDPSGIVTDMSGNPVGGATVTLYRSVDPGGPFVAVSDGSALMSPGNRRNPDMTGVGGIFGWDVVPGFYKVRAEKAGCSAPGGAAFVETEVLTIPPPVTDLQLVLSCMTAPPTPTTLTYTGDTLVISPARPILRATLVASQPACDVVGKTVGFSIDLTGDGDFNDAGESIGTAQTVAGTNNSAWATLAPAQTRQPGVYLVKVTFAGTSGCAASEHVGGVISVVRPGDSANGRGEYKIAGVTGASKAVNFDFTTRWNKRSGSYTGQIVIEDQHAWRLKGEITSFAITSSKPPIGTASGTARLYQWSAVVHSYVLADESVSFKITFKDERSIKKNCSTKPYNFTVNWIVGYGGGTVSPLVTGSSFQQLTRGDITIR